MPEAPELLWSPRPDADSGFRRWLAWLERERGLRFEGYDDAWAWSVRDIEAFWASVAAFCDVRFTQPADTVLAERRMPGARWFDGARLNYALHALRHGDDEAPAILFASETRPLTALSRSALRTQVAALSSALRELGIRPGDRVAAILPNSPPAVVALLSCAAIGAVWTCCPPEFGATAVIDRFAQVRPSAIIAVDGYIWRGRPHDRRAVLQDVIRALPSVRHTILVPELDPAARLTDSLDWDELLQRGAQPDFTAVPFDHPLWILYSSGSTGPPKAIVHGHGGILLEQLKSHVIQNDMRPGDRFFWNTTTGWMMWNSLVGGLLAGCTIVLYDGSSAVPDLARMWRLAEEARVTRFGAGAAFHISCMRAGLQPLTQFDLSALRAIGSTGSPLPAEAFRWIYTAVKPDVWLAPSSGGTEVATAFLGGCPERPVHAGELQGRALGVAAAAVDESGQRVIDEPGELVILEPMPSMPLYFWNDADGARYRDAYFHRSPGVWRHGDLVHLTARGSAVVHGRSDATLNRHGVRIGTAEIYRVAESIPGVEDSLAVAVDRNGDARMLLFVVLEQPRVLDGALQDGIRDAIRERLSPRHVPDEIVQVPAVPRTYSGKKMEVPVRRILEHSADAAVFHAAALDPSAFDAYVELRSSPSAGEEPQVST